MLRQIQIIALNWIGMNVIQLLSHHRFAKYQFGMHTFLPELIFAVVFMRDFGKAQSL